MVLQPGAIPDNQLPDIVGTTVSPANSDYIYIHILSQFCRHCMIDKH